MVSPQYHFCSYSQIGVEFFFHTRQTSLNLKCIKQTWGVRSLRRILIVFCYWQVKIHLLVDKYTMSMSMSLGSAKNNSTNALSSSKIVLKVALCLCVFLLYHHKKSSNKLGENSKQKKWNSQRTPWTNISSMLKLCFVVSRLANNRMFKLDSSYIFHKFPETFNTKIMSYYWIWDANF